MLFYVWELKTLVSEVLEGEDPVSVKLHLIDQIAGRQTGYLERFAPENRTSYQDLVPL
jgi:hypothetical protein